jgi:hypothetical protein
MLPQLQLRDLIPLSISPERERENKNKMGEEEDTHKWEQEEKKARDVESTSVCGIQSAKQLPSPAQ